VYSQTANPHQLQAIVLKRVLEKNHHSPRKSDDKLAAEVFTQFIELLDEEGLYFTSAR
jgi:hypothetical protein